MRAARKLVLLFSLSGALALAALPLLLASGGCRGHVVTDSQGREFVRVREKRPLGDGTSDAELWQLRGKTGDAHPYYLKLLTPEGTPPMFTQTQ